MMKQKLIQMMRWISTKGLIWLGFGATPFIFMACYGPVPTEYREANFNEEVVDSSKVTRSADGVDEDIASEDVAEDSQKAEDQV